MASSHSLLSQGGSLSPSTSGSPLGGSCSPLALDGTAVKMKGLPFKACKDDVVRFFAGFSLRCCYLRKHPDGRPNGEVRRAAVAGAGEPPRGGRGALLEQRPALTCCRRSECAPAARRGASGGRGVRAIAIVVVFFCDCGCFFVENEGPKGRGAGGPLPRQQPRAARADARLHCRPSSTPIVRSRCRLTTLLPSSPARCWLRCVLALSRSPGKAFVVFDSAEEARRATTKDRETFGEKFGERYVRVYPTLESDAADMQQAVAQQDLAPHPQVRGGGLAAGTTTHSSLGGARLPT